MHEKTDCAMACGARAARFESTFGFDHREIVPKNNAPKRRKEAARTIENHQIGKWQVPQDNAQRRGVVQRTRPPVRQRAHSPRAISHGKSLAKGEGRETALVVLVEAMAVCAICLLPGSPGVALIGQ